MECKQKRKQDAALDLWPRNVEMEVLLAIESLFLALNCVIGPRRMQNSSEIWRRVDERLILTGVRARLMFVNNKQARERRIKANS